MKFYLNALPATVILRSVVLADVLPFYRNEQHQEGTLGSYPAQRFISEPEIIAPVPNVVVEASEDVSSNQFVSWAPHGGGIPNFGPQFLDAKTLSLVYQAPTLDSDNFGFMKQSCNGSDYLTWWTGTTNAASATGTFRMFDENLQSVYNVTAIGLEYADCHDMYLTPQCTAVITVSENREHDLIDHGIENGWIVENWIQEIDLATNELLFEWKVSPHLNINDTFWNIGIEGSNDRSGTRRDDGWDFFHINSVNKDAQGNYLVSSRHMHSLYYIDGQTGDIIWTLGGRGNDFKDLSNGKATDFHWQHHSRFASDDSTKISVFDNRNCRYVKDTDPVSRGLLIDIDPTEMTATVVRDYEATAEIQAFRKGGMHYLENGNVLLGYGNEPAFTEYSPNGTVLWDVRFGPIGHDRDTADNYRAYKFNFTGKPTWQPKIAAGPSLDDSALMWPDGRIPTDAVKDTAYFSWNGATDLSRWLVLASNHSTDLTSVTQMWCMVDKMGFESSVKINGEARYVRAVALDKDNDVIGASPVLDMLAHSTWPQSFSLSDFRTEWTQSVAKGFVEKFEENVEEENRWNAQLNAVKDDWSNMRDTQKIMIGVLCGGLFLIALIVGGLTWRHREEIFGDLCTSNLSAFRMVKNGSGDGERGAYELADDERASLDSIGDPEFNFATKDMASVISNLKNEEWRRLLDQPV